MKRSGISRLFLNSSRKGAGKIVKLKKALQMRTSLPARTRFAFLWIALVPILLTVVALTLNHQFRNEVAWVTHTYDVRDSIRRTVLAVWDTDRDMRSYLLTGEDSYLRGMQTGGSQARQRLTELQKLVADNPVQQKNLAQFQSMVEARLNDQQRTLDLWRRGGLNAAANPAEVAQAERSMEQIWNISDTMMREEEGLLIARTRKESAVNLETEVAFAAAILVTLALLLWAARLLKEYAAKRDRAEQELHQKVREIELLNQNLEQHVRERTAELQKSNEDLARSYEANRLLASVVESSDDAIFAKSLEGIIESWNAGAERLYGYKPEEILGHNVRELVPSDRPEEETDILERTRRGEPVEHFETLRLRKGGVPVEVSLTVSPIRNESGELVGASHIARDITEQKRAAEAMRQTQKLESLGVLAGGIAHDFNNLLVGIMGNASLALEHLPANFPARRNLQDVIAAGERAAGLTRQMLAYSGKGRFVIDRIDLSTYIRETVPLIEAAIPRTVQLRLNLEEDLPAIEADATQVQQLVMNLVINGAEAIAEGKLGTVTVITRAEQVSEEYLRKQALPPTEDLKAGLFVLLEVRDTGSGMDEATKSKIFEPFFTTKFTGRGLGLAAVLGIVRGHRGFIQVSSTPGQGTAFRVLFPALEMGAGRRPGALQEARNLTGAGTILVIDDEPIVRKLARQVLEHYGYRVLLAEEGERGVEEFRGAADEILCVVLDLMMPVLSGEETLPRLKALRPDVPIILSSGFSETEAIRRFAGKGLAGFIQKPYKPAELAEKVKNVIATAKPRLGKTGT
jgi:PAS domain S-box-containing protein